jgi:hypothetical protein
LVNLKIIFLIQSSLCFGRTYTAINITTTSIINGVVIVIDIMI